MPDYRRETPAKPPKRLMHWNQIETLLISLIRLKPVRAEAVQHLLPSHFSRDGEAYLAALWTVILDLHPKYGDKKAIPFVVLNDACTEYACDPASGLDDEQQASLLDTPEDVDPEDPRSVPGIIYTAYAVKKHDLHPEFAMELLRRFLVERAALEPITSKVRAAENRGLVLSDVSELFSIGRKAVAKYEALGKDEWESLDVDLDAISDLPVESCGLGFFDRFMDGGPASGEAIGLLGPTGGGKSTVASQMAAERTKRFAVNAMTTGGRGKQCLYLAYEDDFLGDKTPDGGRTTGRIYTRLMSHAASVDRNSIEKRQAQGGYSRRGNLKPYELALFAGSDPATIPGEFERITAATALLKDNLKVASMATGGKGRGGVGEIAAMIERMVDREGLIPGCVIIDSIDRLCGAHLHEQGQDVDKKMRRAILDAVVEARETIAGRFACDVWFVNQLDAGSNKRASTARAHHSDATDAKGWANALDFCWVFNPLDANHFTTFTLSKARRGGYEGQSLVMELRGRFAQWADRSLEYCVHNGEFQPRSAMNVLASPTAAHTRSTRIDQIGNPTGLSMPWDN